MTHNFNSLVKFGLGLFMAGSASLIAFKKQREAENAMNSL